MLRCRNLLIVFVDGPFDDPGGGIHTITQRLRRQDLEVQRLREEMAAKERKRAEQQRVTPISQEDTKPPHANLSHLLQLGLPAPILIAPPEEGPLPIPPATTKPSLMTVRKERDGMWMTLGQRTGWEGEDSFKNVLFIVILKFYF